MEWTNGAELDTLVERQINSVPEWARAEHMELCKPLSELWKLSGDTFSFSLALWMRGKRKERKR